MPLPTLSFDRLTRLVAILKEVDPDSLSRRVDVFLHVARTHLANLASPAQGPNTDIDEAIARGRADVTAGRVVPHEDVRAWLLSWGSGEETTRPTPGIPMADIATALGMSQAYTSKVLADLAHPGDTATVALLRLWENPQNRRQKLVGLTEAGRAVLVRLFHLADAETPEAEEDTDARRARALYRTNPAGWWKGQPTAYDDLPESVTGDLLTEARALRRADAAAGFELRRRVI